MMHDPFDQQAILLLLRLLVAHTLVEVLFQSFRAEENTSKDAWRSRRTYIHGVVSGTVIFVFSAMWTSVWLPLAIFLSHLASSALRILTGGKKLPGQLVKVVVIVACWASLVDIVATDLSHLASLTLTNTKLWILILIYMAAVWPAGRWIGMATEPWRNELEGSASQGLAKAGLWIGRLERILILTFVLLDRFDAIGFLIAAKSIFRFGEIRNPEHRKEAEYILIGTMMSFVIGIILGLIGSWSLEYVS